MTDYDDQHPIVIGYFKNFHSQERCKKPGKAAPNLLNGLSLMKYGQCSGSLEEMPMASHSCQGTTDSGLSELGLISSSP